MKMIEVFSAGCPACTETIETVRTLAGSRHEVAVRDMKEAETAQRAKALGIRSVPAVVIDGHLAGCCANIGPDEALLKGMLQ